MASPFHRKDSLKHNPCRAHIYVSKDPPCAVFQAQRLQKTSSLRAKEIKILIYRQILAHIFFKTVIEDKYGSSNFIEGGHYYN